MRNCLKRDLQSHEVVSGPKKHPSIKTIIDDKFVIPCAAAIEVAVIRPTMEIR